MANYKDLHGFEIKHRSSDPPSPIEGEAGNVIVKAEEVVFTK